MKLNNKRFALSLILLPSCNATSKGLQKINNYVTTHQIDTIAYWKVVNPIMFIDMLTKYPKDIFSIGVYPTTNWYDAKYI
ncbi:MAG: hypothetical protein H7331_06940 [Bacteroidia bacterium]|nr:hypothetical protein [Bacteroidia bacterium]